MKCTVIKKSHFGFWYGLFTESVIVTVTMESVREIPLIAAQCVGFLVDRNAIRYQDTKRLMMSITDVPVGTQSRGMRPASASLTFEESVRRLESSN